MFDWNDAPDTRDTRPDRIDAYADALASDDLERLRALWAADDASCCASCGQVTLTPIDRCDGCERAAHAPQGTQEALFAPAPTPMPGQIMGRWDPYQ